MYEPSPEKKPREITFTEKVKVVNYWLLPGAPKHHKTKFNHKKWSSMKHHYTWLTSERQLYKMKEQVERQQKIIHQKKQVDKHTFNEFLERRSMKEIVKDRDLQKIAMVKAHEIVMDECFQSQLLLVVSLQETF